MTPKNEMSAKKKYLIINFIHLIYKAHQILPTYTKQCHCLHPHSQCLHLSLTPNIPIPFTAIPQYIISLIHCIGYMHF